MTGLWPNILKKEVKASSMWPFGWKNIEEALAELKEKGIKLIDQVPRKGAGGAKIAFLHPKATSGVLVELCER